MPELADYLLRVQGLCELSRSAYYEDSSISSYCSPTWGRSGTGISNSFEELFIFSCVQSVNVAGGCKGGLAILSNLFDCLLIKSRNSSNSHLLGNRKLHCLLHE